MLCLAKRSTVICKQTKNYHKINVYPHFKKYVNVGITKKKHIHLVTLPKMSTIGLNENIFTLSLCIVNSNDCESRM